MDEIFIDLNFLTESERDLIRDVLARDDDFRRQEKKRLSELKKDLETAKKSNAIKVSDSPSTGASGKVCARCHQSFGLFFNTGAFCPKCKARVCKNCRNNVKDSWLCSLCAKVREVKAKSGAWFYDQAKTKSETRSLFGTSLVRASLNRGRKTSSSNEIDDIPTPPVIGLRHDNHNKIHRPIPVHMSAIKEKSNHGNKSDDSYSRDQRDKEMNELNQNYKPYAKALPAKQDYRKTSVSDEEEREEEEQEEEEKEDRDYGRETSLYHDDEHDVTITHSTHVATDKDAQDINDFLDDLEQAAADVKHNQPHDKHDSSYVNGNHDDDYLAEQFHSLPTEYDQPPEHKDHLRVAKDSIRSSTSSVDSYRSALYSTPTETTPVHSDFNTPTETTPVHSDFNTPRHSLPSDEETDFIDARDSTPVPQDSGQFYSLPDHNQDYDSQPADAATPKRSPPQEPHANPAPPQIITTRVDDSPKKKNFNQDNDEQSDDIDQAFAAYGSDFSRLHDKFEMGSRESIVSYYSDAGEGRYGNIPVTGEVEFGLKYDYRRNQLEVQIHKARDIAPVDTKKNRSDPYVKVYLLPDKTKSGKRKTKYKKHTLNPEYDEILTFKVGFDEMLTRSLWLSVWNHDRFGHNDFLGEIIFPLDSYEQSGFSWDYPSAQWYPLRERRPEPSLMEYCGELVIALKYVTPDSKQEKKGKKKTSKGDLYVTMVEAHNLPAKDSNGFSDPFCKSYLLPDKSRKTKRKTPTIKKNLNPVWNHTIVYENLTIEELMDRVLELTVWDWDRGLSNSFLGGVRLGMGTLQDEWDDAEGQEIEAWEAMMQKPNVWNKLTLTLRSSMDTRAVKH